MMNIDEFKEAVEHHLNSIGELIEEHLPDKGDKCCGSQKLCLQQALSEVEHNLNGLEEKDFIKDEE